MRAVNVSEISVVDEPFVLITYTDGFGQMPREVHDFLQINSNKLVAVSASGNRNWRNSFAGSANAIAHIYSVPIILKFEDDGDVDDVEKFKERVHRINEVYRDKQ